MADINILGIPQIPLGYQKKGKDFMVHDVASPLATSTKMIKFEEFLSTKVTYQELVNMISSSSLIEGMYYLILDFQTVYDQPDFDINGDAKTTVITKTAPTIEQIWVYALSSNQITDRAYSATYPNDAIKYDWTYNATEVNGSPAKGRISERIDEYGNRTDYDHRTILFKRYDNGSGVFNQYKDNGNASQEILTFGNSYPNVAINNNYIGDYRKYSQLFGEAFLLANNVINGTQISINTIGDYSLNNTIGDNFVSNKLFSGFYGNVVGSDFSYNVANNFFYQNVIGNGFGGGANNLGNLINYEFSNNIVGNNFALNEITSHTSNNTIGNDFILNKISINNCVIGNNFTYNKGSIGQCNTPIFDFSNINNCDFGYFDAGALLNGITTLNHPEIYGLGSKSIIIDNTNVYHTKYFNGTAEIYSIIN